MRLGALILAGGRSRRMGRPKESLRFGDRTLLHLIAERMLECADPVVVVRRNSEQGLPELPAAIAVIDDDPPSRGPLAGIATGLRHCRSAGMADADAVFVTACDSPFLRAADARWLADQLASHDVVVPSADGILQPLCAIYRIRTVVTAEQLLARGDDAAHALGGECDTRVLAEPELAAHDPELRFLRNVNTPADYEQAHREYLQSPP